MKQIGGVYTVPARVNGTITLNFILDSGAAEILIPANVALTLLRTGTLSENDFRGTGTYDLANGTTEINQKIILRTLQVGRVTLTNVPASVGAMRGQLLLGQSFLSRLKSWSVDNTTHSLVIAAPPKSASASSTAEDVVRPAATSPARAPVTDQTKDDDGRVALIRASMALGGRCTAPIIPVAVYVDGGASSASQIIAGVAAFNRYQKASEAYQQCLTSALAELKHAAAAASRSAQIDPLVEKGVAEMITSSQTATERVGSTLHAAVLTYKAHHR